MCMGEDRRDLPVAKPDWCAGVAAALRAARARRRADPWRQLARAQRLRDAFTMRHPCTCDAAPDYGSGCPWRDPDVIARDRRLTRLVDEWQAKAYAWREVPAESPPVTGAGEAPRAAARVPEHDPTGRPE
jgi:hypothetical protein